MSSNQADVNTISYQLSRVRPRNRSHRDGETADEEVRAHNHSLRRSLVVLDNPDEASTLVRPVPEAPLDAADEEHPEAHEESPDKQHRTTTPFVNVDDGGDGERHVKDILDGLR
jgi:hypothetical protein